MGALRGYTKWILFFSSYIPLYLLLSVYYLNPPMFTNSLIDGKYSPSRSVAWFSVAIVSGIFLLLVLFLRTSKEPAPIEIQGYERENKYYAFYIMTYTIPLIEDTFPLVEGGLFFITLFLLLGYFQTRSDLLYINPVLGLLGYHIYKIELGQRKASAITKDKIRDMKHPVRAVELSDDCYVLV